MKSRFNIAKTTPGLYEAMDCVDQYIAECGLERSLVCLVQLRISQINGCAHCIDMHWKDLRALGGEEQRSNRLSIASRLVAGIYEPGTSVALSA